VQRSRASNGNMHATTKVASMGRLKILAAAAGFFLMLKAPAFAQSPAQPRATSAAGDYDDSQSSGDTPWWQDDNWWDQDYDDYQTVWLTVASCRYWSQPSGTWQSDQRFWSDGSDGAWEDPAGSPWQYPYHSGWCRSNYGYANQSHYVLFWVNKNPLPTKKHQPKRHNDPRAAAEKAHGESNPDGGGPDDEWTRVENNHAQQAAARQPQHDEEMQALPRRQPVAQHSVARQHLAQQQKLQRDAEKIQNLERRHFAQERAFERSHGGARPADHIVARAGARSHT
jgi:hypothetical protein